ncbi:hypothetical protein PRIPAC_78576 [Pristionchus pacificus]|uniref:Uncharacterized protein n=1 Tax=Pristionchus pacificus TaxID=54126 RepID=A0A454XZK2_PRIPA|nr:hypothetical protein PRIPAC_78576 [Pristionchus pacificus]|eukprot:PDM79967.1 hypothetical protein PRIPAC_32546 [Pristionchus pacificus]
MEHKGSYKGKGRDETSITSLSIFHFDMLRSLIVLFLALFSATAAAVVFVPRPVYVPRPVIYYPPRPRIAVVRPVIYGK